MTVQLSLTRSVSAALVMESVLIAAIILFLSHSSTPPLPKPQKVMMVTMNAAIPAPPQPSAPPKPVVKTQPKIDPHAFKKQVVKKVQPKPVKTEEVAKPTPTTAQNKAVTQPTHAEKPTQAAQGKPDINAVFREKIRSAVQNAVIYPAAARISHLIGDAQVWFMYRNGKVSSPKILTRSGSGMLDRAAIAAVSNAEYPMPTKDLADRDLAFEVWVKFTQTAD
jgi:protein TonB